MIKLTDIAWWHLFAGISFLAVVSFSRTAY